jgi:anti-sigma factor RsiW
VAEHRQGELLGPFLLGELTAGEERELERHLEGCAGCRRELDLLGQTHHLLRLLVANEPPPDLKSRTLERAKWGASAAPETDGGPD